MANDYTGEGYNPIWCRERHEEINRRMAAMERDYITRNEKLDKRLWGILVTAGVEAVMLIGVLITLVIMLLR